MDKRSKSASALAGYLCPLMEKTGPSGPVGVAITNWCWENETMFGVDMSVVTASRGKGGVRKRNHRYGKAIPKTAWDKILKFMRTCASEQVTSPIVKNAKAIASIVGLDALDTEIFVFAAFATDERAFDHLIDQVVATRLLDTIDVMSIMIGAEASDIAVRFYSGSLYDLNFIDGTDERPGEFELYVPYRVMSAVRVTGNDQKDMQRAILGDAAQPDLAWSDFDHIARERDFASRLIEGAVAKKQRGVNILLYGAPGEGKTELAKVLAKQAGCDLFVVAERDEDGAEPDREERLASLRRADRLALRRGAAVILFDEMEDLLEGCRQVWTRNRRFHQKGSKANLNRMLEQNETPVIWTTNSIHSFDPAFLRRMMFTIELKTPPASIRSRQWRRLARKSGVKLSKRRANELASDHALPPSFARTALQAVSTAGKNADEVDFALNAAARPVAQRAPHRKNSSQRKFDLALLNPDCNVLAIEKRLRKEPRFLDVSFCLYGPPGSGKTELASHFAHCMDIEMLEKRGSDLMSPWVGETERRIADAFAEAADDKKLLVIDEAESLLWIREGAQRSWETSMVNEFLIGLERSPVPVVCTTNHLDRIDAAALRRFTFKMKLDYLTGEQVDAAFRLYFDKDAPASLKRCAYLTPGDFAVIKKQLRFCAGGEETPEKIASMLEQEARIKQKGMSRIGF